MGENYRAVNAAKAREARAAGADQKAADRLTGRGYLIIRPDMIVNGFPVPDRPLNPIHFKDSCSACTGNELHAPHAREERPDGARFSYQCWAGHVWTCYLSDERQRRYYADCPCDYCVGRLARNLETRDRILMPANWSAA